MSEELLDFRISSLGLSYLRYTGGDMYIVMEGRRFDVMITMINVQDTSRIILKFLTDKPTIKGRRWHTLLLYEMKPKEQMEQMEQMEPLSSLPTSIVCQLKIRTSVARSWSGVP